MARPSNADLRNAQREYVTEVLKHTGLPHRTALARAVGFDHSALSNLFNDKKTGGLSSKTLADIAQKTGVPLPKVLAERVKITPNESVATTQTAGPDMPQTDLPVFGTATLGKEGLVLERGKPTSHTIRPFFLSSSPDAYAVNLPDDSMGDVLRRGRLVYVDPNRAVRLGDEVLVELGDGWAHCRILVSVDDKHVTVRRLFPEKTEEKLPVARVAHIHKLMGYDPTT